MYTAWYNGAPSNGSTNGQITKGNAIGVYPTQAGSFSQPNYDSNNTRINDDIFKYVQFENRFLGLARMRQLRVLS